MNLNIKKIPLNYFTTTLIVTINEFRRNLISWITPLPFLAGVLWFSWMAGWEQINLNIVGTWSYLVLSILLAMVYGLQSFSNDADRKTLDFTLTKPLSLYVIVLAKYCTGLIMFWGWWNVFSVFLQPDLTKLALPNGIGIEWVILTLLVAHATSFLAGLLARGLERFFVITVLTGILAYCSYWIWLKVFNLAKANFLWFDLPPHLLFFIQQFLPYYLAILSLAVSLTGVIWYLKNKINIWRFKPAWLLISVWLVTLLLVELAEFCFGPPLWPDQSAQYGDWHSQKGIVLAGLLNNKTKSNTKKSNSRLTLNKFGHKPQVIYTGTNLKNPRFSPDGNKILFCENDRLKILELPTKRISDIGKGEIGTWAQDGEKIISARNIGPKGLSLLYLFDLAGNKRAKLTSKAYNLADLVWDSARNNLYIFGYTDQLQCLNLKNYQIRDLSFPEKDKPKFFGIVKPSLRLNKGDDVIFIGQVFARTANTYILNLKTEQIRLSEEKSDFRLKTNGVLLFNHEGTAIIWPRIDGGFVYQSSYFAGKEHQHDHDHEE